MEPVGERWAPTLLKNLHGRLSVSPRTVILELPQDFKAIKAAMKFLSLNSLRRVSTLSDSPAGHPSYSLLEEVSQKQSSFADIVKKLKAIEGIVPAPGGSQKASPLLLAKKYLEGDSDEEGHDPMAFSLVSRVSERLEGLERDRFEERSPALGPISSEDIFEEAKRELLAGSTTSSPVPTTVLEALELSHSDNTRDSSLGTDGSVHSVILTPLVPEQAQQVE